jgi:hypothetical protein
LSRGRAGFGSRVGLEEEDEAHFDGLGVEVGGRRGRIDVVVMMGGGIRIQSQGSIRIGSFEWVGYEVEEVQMPNWLWMKERSQLNREIDILKYSPRSLPYLPPSSSTDTINPSPVQQMSYFLTTKCNSSMPPHAHLSQLHTYTRIIRRILRMQRKKRGNKPPVYTRGRLDNSLDSV